MTNVIRIFSTRHSDAIEKLTGVRVVANVLVKRGSEKPLYIRSIVAKQNC